MSQKPDSGPYDDAFYGPHSPISGNKGLPYGDPTIPTHGPPDQEHDDPTIPAPGTPGRAGRHNPDTPEIAEVMYPDPAPHNPDTPGTPGSAYPDPGPYISANPYVPGTHYEPYANAYPPPPPPPDQTISATNAYEYGPTIISRYPPPPEMPHQPTQAPLSKPPWQSLRNKTILAALLALLVIVGSTLFAMVNYNNNRATIDASAQQTAIASNYPFSNKLVLSDPLIGDNATTYGWANNGQSCFFAENAYHDAYQLPGYYKPCIATNTNFANFTFQAQMVIKQGDDNVGGGLIFRADTAAYKFYRLFITTRGYYQLRIYVDRFGNHSRLLNDGIAPPFHTGSGETNKIAVKVVNDLISLYVNKQLVATTSDDTFNHGQIGFNVDNPTSKNAEVIFTNARVWRL